MKNYKVRAIEELRDKTFKVEKYQRGYKWGIGEVCALLNDINEFDIGGQSFYCLQPVVVMRLDKDFFELIDGQQRLTTIYITLQCMQSALFGMTYRTREQSEHFLLNITHLEKLDLDIDQDEKKLKTALNAAWYAYAGLNKENDNVDNYHFFIAYQIISNWLKKQTEENRLIFKEKLLVHTKVIWYRIISDESPEQIFINFNRGKIQLEQAELIKALFVLKLRKKPNAELRAYRTNQFADEWNVIENQLQDDNFWFFVSNDSSDRKQANRIDLLFDILSGKPRGDQDPLYAYHKYLKILNAADSGSVAWSKVSVLFNLLNEWYSERNVYHLLGLLIYLELKTVAEVYIEYEQLSDKDIFESVIKGWIRGGLKFDEAESKYATFKMAYGDNEALKAMVIFNIATYQKSDVNYRFPFDKLKTQSWSLEHIHAQKAEKFKVCGELRDWIDDIGLLIANEKQVKDIIMPQLSDLSAMIAGKDDSSVIARTIMEKAKSVNFSLDSLMDVDSIRNICLLDGPTNSALSNLNFRKKREKLLKIDARGEVENEKGELVRTFIPVCTKNVFLKYYSTDSDNIQFTYWGANDRMDYEEKVETIVKKYLNPATK
ncbi:DUF262 domain-containing protein [Mucilaginibacter lutimaris]|uniref:DUF262 domain-containing protein n=1 Tax=Mucilaginibacter lutimaris TaxID=931629 RepID=A0ABW2ZM02_9SPHI